MSESTLKVAFLRFILSITAILDETQLFKDSSTLLSNKRKDAVFACLSCFISLAIITIV